MSQKKAREEIRVCADRYIEPQFAARLAVEEEAENEPKLQYASVGNTNRDRRQSAVILTGKKWATNRILAVAFSSRAQPAIVNEVWQRFKYIGGLISLNFVRASAWEDADIRVGFVAGDGSWSYIGTDAKAIDPGARTMNFGWFDSNTSPTEFDRVAIHEVLHTIGMPHEHQHPRAGIPWDRPRVYDYYGGPPNNWTREQVDANIFRKYSESITQFDAFDPTSIMAYPVPNSLTIGDFEIGWNNDLSETDERFIKEQYPKRILS